VKNINVMIATPAFNAQVYIQYMLAFAATSHMLLAHNIMVTPCIVPASSLLVAERNKIIQAFWDSDCTHLLCIDADIGWPPEAVLKLLQDDREFIACCYPARSSRDLFIFRPIFDEKTAIVHEKDLLKMESVPAGFMLLQRSAIKKMRKAHPHLYYQPKHRDPNDPYHAGGYLLFNTEIVDGEFFGEDYIFCKRAADAGVDIWCDPNIPLDHAGKVGALADILSTEPNSNSISVKKELLAPVNSY
jgi:hypothetical protein